MPRVYAIANGLSDQMVADRPDLEAVLLEYVASALTITVILERAGYIEMIAPTGQFQPVISPGRCLFCERIQSQIGPLACEKRNGTGHGTLFEPRAPEVTRSHWTRRRWTIGRDNVGRIRPWEKGQVR